MSEPTLSPFLELLDNGVLAWGLIACGFAQLSKLIVELITKRTWRPAVLLETGGMPSSHSALVSGIAAGVGWQEGFAEPIFAISVTLALVVMYDASGIRKAAGLTAARVNLLPADSWQEPNNQALNESLGHTRTEVFVGSIIGPSIALPGIVFLGSPLHLLQIVNLTFG